MKQLIKPRHLLITGGSRSGKSKFAECQAELLGGQVVYLATAEAGDSEMAERILKHQQRRPPDWVTVEAPLDVIKTLSCYQAGYTILVDCLTMYLSNLYFKYEQTSKAEALPQLIDGEMTHLAEVITSSAANLIIVTNEVGWGIIPDNPLARVFRDLAGLSNQQIAAVCDEVYLVVSGIPMEIKGAADV
jgi:adenosylcobinamide kinase / adenosylcobinamide-phosphate guanylyltransferase